MKKNILFISLCVAVFALLVAIFLFGGNGNVSDTHVHEFSTEWTYDETHHWKQAVCEHTDEISEKNAHGEDNKIVIKEATETETGLAEYTCEVCGYKYQKAILISTQILSIPEVSTEKVYIGQKLSSITLEGGAGSVEGSFVWSNPDLSVTQSGEYSVTFIPSDEKYDRCECKVYINAEQLTITVTYGENGICTPGGTVNVDYGSSLAVSIIPNLGYAADTVTVDGAKVNTVSQYTFSNITSAHTLHAEFKEGEMTVDIVCVDGTSGAYTISGNTITFTEKAAGSIYALSGTMLGNIVIDVGENDFELELRGLTLTSNADSAILIKSGDKIKITAKKDFENFIYDVREAVDENDENAHSGTIFSDVDLDIGGKGSLTIESENNNGIHTKDDLEVKNLTLVVKCVNNALKGNDSVTVLSGDITLIARKGDGIKTTNSDISSKGNQRGNVTISGGTLNIYAACDGIDSAHDVIIDEANAEVALNIYTDKYSEYSENVENTDNNSGINYISFTSSYYKFSVKYYNSEDDFVWVNAEYHSKQTSNRTTYHFFTYPDKPEYAKIKIFMYGDQAQGQESEYILCTDYIVPNDSYDTFELSYRGNNFYYNWTNYSSYQQSGPGGPGGMMDGNKDKGEYSTKGIKAANEISINAGNINIKSYDDAIHTDSGDALENGKTSTGNINIYGGNITLYTNDDGIHAGSTVNILQGTINITNCYEGIEGTNVKIADGNISIVSKDDGINATASSGTGISFEGGRMYIYAGGDGMDTNSRASYSGMVFSGGEIVVICTSGGNSAIDTEQGYKYTGGKIVAITASSGMGGGMGGGMASETYHCQNFESLGTKQSISLTSGKYLEVTMGDTDITVKMPCSLSSLVVCLGSTNAKISQASTSSATLDTNGVCWN